MKRKLNAIGIASVLCLATIPLLSQAADQVQKPMASEGKSAPNVDNSRMNERDKNSTAATPQDQPNNPDDTKLLANVRKSIVNNKSLSMAAHNVKILVNAGAVTLRGPVQSDAEKMKIEKLAHRVKGVSSVDNQLDVKTN
ncbi:BON domain-containing protein [Undibacterium sp. TJN25]|uniref:BON domain-containing protein n=1 Tax=Undibacterium sp. TJN25 TaxID=3413056 RepID=UPI003BF0DCD8